MTFLNPFASIGFTSVSFGHNAAFVNAGAKVSVQSNN